MSPADRPHSDVRALITEREERGVPDLNGLSVTGARQLRADLFVPPDDPEPVGSVRNLTIEGREEGVPIRVYEPDGDPPFPVLVFLHGGGWVFGDLDRHDPICRALTNTVGCVVVSVDYRLAPEHPFPAAVEDCRAATEWVSENCDAVHGDHDRIAIGGESAGGNLAAAVAQIARDRDGPKLARQVLLYPPTERSFDTRSYDENAEGYVLTTEAMKWFWDKYLETDLDGQNPYASPLRARDLTGLPPATVVTAGFDPLRDDGTAYANRLEEAGVSVTHRQYEEMIHGFATMLVEPEWAQARDVVGKVASDLRSSFETG